MKNHLPPPPPPPPDDTLILMCGPSPMIRFACKPVFLDSGPGPHILHGLSPLSNVFNDSKRQHIFRELHELIRVYRSWFHTRCIQWVKTNLYALFNARQIISFSIILPGHTDTTNLSVQILLKVNIWSCIYRYEHHYRHYISHYFTDYNANIYFKTGFKIICSNLFCLPIKLYYKSSSL